MSAQVHSDMPPPPHRHPLSSASNHQVVQPRQFTLGTPPPKQLPQPPQQPQDKPKQPASPPLRWQNAKVTPPSPPMVITDKAGTLEFFRVGMLGEGGSARVYEVKDCHGSRAACKVVIKSCLKTKDAKTKLYAEIKIHRSLDHPNIVRFQECFEDKENVYMILELCHNGSLMDMHRRRRHFTEPEARFFMVQLIGVCQYMHTHQVIHRDLKLGNIFLDANMNVKVGDFGLAALIENPGERKKTICGTPNYIAPEILSDTANGYSFEVDTWSIGVVLYTLIVGCTPFQTKDIKATYKRIRDNDYEFPADPIVSLEVQDLIQQILTPDPHQRPTLQEIVDHDFFTGGIVPGYIPVSAHDAPPDFGHITRPISQANLARLRKYALLDEKVTSIAAPSSVPSSACKAAKGATSSLAQLEKEFQKAVQLGSPISALLSLARQRSEDEDNTEVMTTMRISLDPGLRGLSWEEYSEIPLHLKHGLNQYLLSLQIVSSSLQKLQLTMGEELTRQRMSFLTPVHFMVVYSKFLQSLAGCSTITHFFGTYASTLAQACNNFQLCKSLLNIGTSQEENTNQANNDLNYIQSDMKVYLQENNSLQTKEAYVGFNSFLEWLNPQTTYFQFHIYLCSIINHLSLWSLIDIRTLAVSQDNSLLSIWEAVLDKSIGMDADAVKKYINSQVTLYVVHKPMKKRVFKLYAMNKMKEQKKKPEQKQRRQEQNPEQKNKMLKHEHYKQGGNNGLKPDRDHLQTQTIVVLMTNIMDVINHCRANGVPLPPQVAQIEKLLEFNLHSNGISKLCCPVCIKPPNILKFIGSEDLKMRGSHHTIYPCRLPP